MSRTLASLAAVALVVAACAPDATAPTAAPRPGPASPLYASRFGYLPTVLPLQYATAINSSGAIVGALPNGWGVYYAQGVATVLPLPSDGSATQASPVALLDDGRILARGLVGGTMRRALYYPGPTSGPTAIGVPGQPSGTTYGHAMNGQGIVAGSYQLYAGAPLRAFRWTPDAGFTDITPADQPGAEVSGIARTGEMIGWVGINQGGLGYRWDAGGASGMALPAGLRALQALNGGNVLVAHPTFRFAIWSPTAITPAGPDPTTYRVAKIGPGGRFIGSFWNPETGHYQAWTSIGIEDVTVLPLPDGFASAYAIDVNACGTILGEGVRASDAKSFPIVWSKRFPCDNSGTYLNTFTQTP